MHGCIVFPLLLAVGGSLVINTQKRIGRFKDDLICHIPTFDQFNEDLYLVLRGALAAQGDQKFLRHAFAKLNLDEDGEDAVEDHLADQSLHCTCVHSGDDPLGTDGVDHLLEVHVIDKLVGTHLHVVQQERAEAKDLLQSLAWVHILRD